MKITILGAGGFIPQPDRPLPAYALEHDGETFLFDCGEGTQVRMVEYGVSSAKLEGIFISHLHGDHVFGLPGVMVRRSQEGQRREHLDVFAPESLESFLGGLSEAGSLDLLYPWSVQPLSDKKSYTEKNLTFTAASLDHRTPNFGFAVEHHPSIRKFFPEKARRLGVPEGPLWSQLQGGGSIELDSGRVVRPEEVSDPPPEGPTFVYLTDTRPCYDLPEAFYAPDLIVHEGMFTAEHQQHAREKKHSTAREAARVAKHLEAEKLLLTHISHRYSDKAILLDEAREIFRDTELAQEGEVFELH